MKFSTLIPLAALLSVSAAEFPDKDLSQCLRMCLTMGAQVAGCASYVDTSCTCPSDAFRNTVGTCLKDSCTQKDIDSKLLIVYFLRDFLSSMLIYSSAAAASLHKQVCGTNPQ
ncbi:hypothetical protein N7523_001769 [Penicillium sp. IBT 18751x]|nr:hypothetical protein N7523_001769 [Penicillium sp. IBT 18751x]